MTKRLAEMCTDYLICRDAAEDIICNRSNAMVMAGAGLLPSTNLQIRHTVSQKGQLMCFCG